MDRLISLLDGEAKRVICAIGKNGVFYALLWRPLKENLRIYILYHICILELPSISPDNNKGLRHFHQPLNWAATWLNSVGYVSSLRSTDNVIKAVLRLPKYLRMSFYKQFTAENFDEENINLIKFESWLGTKVSSTFNPIALVIENKLKSKHQGRMQLLKEVSQKF